ncbi:MAG TPA: hypothetical protein VL123_05950 [Candidatus Udaeobacter sp.]|nr:hypothetical protein [Candidatus Udaeobacter sp.]
MIKMRKLFALAMVAVLASTVALAVVSCGKKAEETTTTTTTTTTTSESTGTMPESTMAESTMKK